MLYNWPFKTKRILRQDSCSQEIIICENSTKTNCKRTNTQRRIYLVVACVSQTVSTGQGELGEIGKSLEWLDTGKGGRMTFLMGDMCILTQKVLLGTPVSPLPSEAEENLELTQTWAFTTKPQELHWSFREEPSSSTSAEGRGVLDSCGYKTQNFSKSFQTPISFLPFYSRGDVAVLSQEGWGVTHKRSNHFSLETSHTKSQNLAMHLCVAVGGLTAKLPLCFGKNFHHLWCQLTSQGSLRCQGVWAMFMAIKVQKLRSSELGQILQYLPTLLARAYCVFRLWQKTSVLYFKNMIQFHKPISSIQCVPGTLQDTGIER